MVSDERTSQSLPARSRFVTLVAIVLVLSLAVTLTLRGSAPAPATLGIGADQVQHQLETAGIQFSTRVMTDGIPSIGGSAADGSVNLSLTGAPTTLTRAVIIVSLPSAPDGNHPVASAGSASEQWMRLFFESVLPQWGGATAWWRANAAATTTSARTTVGSAAVVLTARQTPSTGNWDLQTCVAPIGAPGNLCL